ncbi:amidohydrolase-domain-containing protein [Rhodocollybia butyracea]|uniref:Amidohydrolase-domain-containing protein n=1 Tax=Rhodocollybia butyracea TaxID=206335 RepID=A0A9P5Q5L3_9AGAR|nr:amidohydrolase-domain-containing protein [Rhodocollybia butyracea]
MSSPQYDLLRKTALSFPAIDNHAHPLLKSQYRNKDSLESSISEASEETGKQDATQTLACFRAAIQLAKVLGIQEGSGSSLWQQVKQHRDTMDYDELCNTFMTRCGIQSILLDDGLGVTDWVEDWKWHRRFGCDTKRVVRIEIEAESLIGTQSDDDTDIRKQLLTVAVEFFTQLYTSLDQSAQDTEVAAFKSIICYRGGLNIRPQADLGIGDTEHDYELVIDSLLQVVAQLILKKEGTIRLAHGAINEWIVHWGLRVAGKRGIPVQFHTGLGDPDIPLVFSSPAHMQSLIKEYPDTTFVLLHAAYPYTKDAGYLCSVYPNVILDFGEVFPMVSGSGQRSIIRQVLELCPTNKILWSTDGHWHPESFYLGALQARQALLDVLAEYISAGELTEVQAVEIVERALFWNSNRVYKLGIVPQPSD